MNYSKLLNIDRSLGMGDLINRFEQFKQELDQSMKEEI